MLPLAYFTEREERKRGRRREKTAERRRGRNTADGGSREQKEGMTHAGKQGLMGQDFTPNFKIKIKTNVWGMLKHLFLWVMNMKYFGKTPKFYRVNILKIGFKQTFYGKG